jgi:hypothetical protein
VLVFIHRYICIAVGDLVIKIGMVIIILSDLNLTNFLPVPGQELNLLVSRLY